MHIVILGLTLTLTPYVSYDHQVYFCLKKIPNFLRECTVRGVVKVNMLVYSA